MLSHRSPPLSSLTLTLYLHFSPTDVYPEQAERRPPVAMTTADAALRTLLRRTFQLQPVVVGGDGGSAEPDTDQETDLVRLENGRTGGKVGESLTLS